MEEIILNLYNLSGSGYLDGWNKIINPFISLATLADIFLPFACDMTVTAESFPKAQMSDTNAKLHEILFYDIWICASSKDCSSGDEC
jgi:hypothetical protein